MTRKVPNTASEKNQEIYDHADDEIWRRAVYQPVHDGWHFANICGRRFLDFIGTRARLGPRSEVLDLCCGSGAADCYLAERFNCAITGIDINRRQLQRARVRARALEHLRFVQADASRWRPDRPFSLVFSLDSLTLVEDLSALLITCRHALRSRGLLAFADVIAGPNLSDEMRAFALAEDGAVALATADQIGAKIEASGFTNVEIADLRTEAVRAFTLIGRSLETSDQWGAVPAQKIAEWKLLSKRYLDAFTTGELGYSQIVATAS